ncbi:MAG: sigma-54-dependent Fis family transcriptional regulator [Acidobacteria bacterium]|nr:sigma-54-dependent Fis family transcriptional regulator [Acidobacteriota bacterium]
MRALLDTVDKALDHDVNILILGESGSGKGWLAETIHRFGSRRDEPFVHVDCAAIPVDLFESELFGFEKGTFTGAVDRKAGRLELAKRGTVYFDEIASLAQSQQAKLLRALEERRFTRLGGAGEVHLEARVVSSSSADVNAALRRDLLYRINVLTVTLPPLRERKEDVARLAEGFARNAGKRVHADALRLLEDYAWPGNVRELRNAIERAALMTDGDTIVPSALPLAEPAELVTVAARDGWTLDELEARYIREVLRQTKENYSRAAEILGINRKTLLEKRRKYGIE